MSKELGLIGLVKHSGPDSEMISRIQKLDRTVPDPALFAIPAGNVSAKWKWARIINNYCSLACHRRSVT